MFEALEASALAEHLRRSRWTYPLVNTGHIAGIAILVGAVVPMTVETLRGSANAPALILRLRPYAVAGLLIAVTCGSLLFIAQAGEYLKSPWFLTKLGLISLAVVNAALHLRSAPLPVPAALASLMLWGAALVAGRMIGYG